MLTQFLLIIFSLNKVSTQILSNFKEIMFKSLKILWILIIMHDAAENAIKNVKYNSIKD